MKTPHKVSNNTHCLRSRRGTSKGIHQRQENHNISRPTMTPKIKAPQIIRAKKTELVCRPLSQTYVTVRHHDSTGINEQILHVSGQKKNYRDHMSKRHKQMFLFIIHLTCFPYSHLSCSSYHALQITIHILPVSGQRPSLAKHQVPKSDPSAHPGVLWKVHHFRSPSSWRPSSLQPKGSSSQLGKTGKSEPPRLRCSKPNLCFH